MNRLSFMKSHTQLNLVGFALLAGLALTGFGCAPKTVTIDGDTVATGKTTYTDEQGNVGTVELRGENEAPPEGFPKEFPIMKGFTVLSYTSVNQEGGAIYGGEWTAKASIADIYAYYKKELPDNGWVIQTTSTYNESSSIMFSKKGDQRYSGTLSMEKEPDGNTKVTLGLFFMTDVGAIYGNE